MRRHYRILFVFVVVISIHLGGSIPPATAGASEPSARKLIEGLINETQSTGERFEVTMKVLSAAGVERVPNRVFTTLTFSPARGTVKSLFTFHEPGNIKGSKILTVKTGSESGQWLYLASSKKTVRVNSGDDSEDILDSDLSFADIQGESLDDYDYQLAPAEHAKFGSTQCGEPADAVSATPKNPGKSPYSKRIIYISKSKSVLCGMTLYDKSKKIAKTLQNEGFRKLENAHWRPAKTVVAVVDSRGKPSNRTEMIFSGWKFKIEAKDSLFSPNSLTE